MSPRTAAGMVTAIERAIAHNARCLGEAPSVGIHVLRDGRVRIFDLDKGWRRRPYKEYSAIERAYAAGMQSVIDARQVRSRIRAGEYKADAVMRVTDARRYMPWPVSA